MRDKVYQTDKYYTHGEMCELFKTWKSKYANIFDYEVIGHSYENREIWAATVTDFSTRAPQEKPAYYIDANHHAGEVTGSAVALYTIDYLLAGYCNGDSVVKQLLTDFTFYIIPRIAVDGSELYLTTPFMLRSSVREYSPLQHQGTIMKDIDNDGRILQMRIKSSTGSYKISEHDPRLMVRRQPDDCCGDFYDVYIEGEVEAYNGVEIRPPRTKWGLDLNRNYPMNWQPENRQRGAGPYPLSEPETRTVAEFILNHQNIAGVMSYHTSGGIILRPRCAFSDKDIPQADLETFKKIGVIGEDITGYPCWSIFEKFTVNKDKPTVGSFVGFVYDYLGIFSFATELWDMRGRAGLKKLTLEERVNQPIAEAEHDDLALLKWNDENFDGKLFVNWYPFNHPQLGEVELGGWEPKFGRQNPPSNLLEEECHKNMLFTLSHAKAMPRLQWLSTNLTPLSDSLYRISVEFVNAGYLPTAGSQTAIKNKISDKVFIRLSENVTIVNGEAEYELKSLNGFAKAKAEWVISAAASDVVQVSVETQRAGMIKKEFLINN